MNASMTVWILTGLRDAPAAIKGHISDAVLSRDDTGSPETWLGRVGKELQDRLAE